MTQNLRRVWGCEGQLKLWTMCYENPASQVIWSTFQFNLIQFKTLYVYWLLGMMLGAGGINKINISWFSRRDQDIHMKFNLVSIRLWILIEKEGKWFYLCLERKERKLHRTNENVHLKCLDWVDSWKMNRILTKSPMHERTWYVQSWWIVYMTRKLVELGERLEMRQNRKLRITL